MTKIHKLALRSIALAGQGIAHREIIEDLMETEGAVATALVINHIAQAMGQPVEAEVIARAMVIEALTEALTPKLDPSLN